jgi:hypothetical protein
MFAICLAQVGGEFEILGLPTISCDRLPRDRLSRWSPLLGSVGLIRSLYE